MGTSWELHGAEIEGLVGIKAGKRLVARLERVVRVTLIILDENWLGNTE